MAIRNVTATEIATEKENAIVIETVSVVVAVVVVDTIRRIGDNIRRHRDEEHQRDEAVVVVVRRAVERVDVLDHQLAEAADARHHLDVAAQAQNGEIEVPARVARVAVVLNRQNERNLFKISLALSSFLC